MEIHLVKSVIFILIVLFGLQVGELAKAPSPKPPLSIKALKPQVKQVEPKAPILQAKKVSQSVLPHRQKTPFDKSAFLKDFKRQGGEGLLICLKAADIKSPLILTAKLLKNGQLVESHQLSFQKLLPLPPCLQSILKEMTFRWPKKNSEPESIEIQWSLEF